MILDHKLTFMPHIKELLRKVCSKAAALRRIRRFIPQQVMIQLYKAYILPHFEYCSPLLLGIGEMEKNKLEDTNRYILRTILGLPKSTPYEELLKIARMKTLAERRVYNSMVLLFKCIKIEAGPIYISNLFKQKLSVYNMRGSRLELPNFNLQWNKNSFTYICSKLWNTLPGNMQLCQDLNNFKSFLRKHILLNCDIFHFIFLLQHLGRGGSG